MPPAPPFEGQCRCGQVRFRIKAPPLLTMACHCRGCQRMTGGPYSLSVAAPAEAFEVTAGEPVIGGLHGASRHFHCPHCLSWLFTRPEGADWLVNVRTPMLDAAADFPPFIETYASTRLPGAATGAVHSYDAFSPLEAYEGLIKAYSERT